MSESTGKPNTFLGTYFDRDAVMRLARWIETAAWVILGLYLLSWSISLLVFIGQFSSGLFFAKGMSFLDTVNLLFPYILQPVPGLIYFFTLQAVSKALQILLDLEDNTRRAARK